MCFLHRNVIQMVPSLLGLRWPKMAAIECSWIWTRYILKSSFTWGQCMTQKVGTAATWTFNEMTPLPWQHMCFLRLCPWTGSPHFFFANWNWVIYKSEQQTATWNVTISNQISTTFVEISGNAIQSDNSEQISNVFFSSLPTQPVFSWRC